MTHWGDVSNIWFYGSIWFKALSIQVIYVFANIMDTLLYLPRGTSIPKVNLIKDCYGKVCFEENYMHWILKHIVAHVDCGSMEFLA